MKSSSFLLALVLCAGSAMAQNSITNSVPGTFVDISGLAGAQALVSFDTDDASFAFTSTVTNAVFTSTNVHACSNGYLQFGAATGATAYFNGNIVAGTSSPVTPNDAQALFPFWDDQYIRPGEGGNIYWVEGSAASFGLPAAAGNVLIVQWNSVDHYFDSPEPGTYQVQIFQNPIAGSVVAQMLYQDIVFGDAVNYDNGASATIGFASGTTGGSASVNNVEYSYNTAGAVIDGTVLSLQLPTGPTNPAVTGITPSAAQPGDTVVLTANVAGGINPNSTNLQVRGNLTAIGGSATAVFHDDGLNGDATAGDHVYSIQYVIPAAQPGGNYTVALSVTDAQGRSGTGSLTGYIFNPFNLGTLTDGTAVNTTVELAPAEVKWYRAVIADCSDAAQRNLRVTTENSTNGGDSEIGVYDSVGTLMGADDDGGGNLLSLLSFGYRGFDGDIGPGTIFIAVGSFNTNFLQNFETTSTGPGGTFELTLLQTTSFPPEATAAAADQGGGNVLITVAVTPGVNPNSTGIQVHLDLSPVGGSANQAMHDDGLNGDAAAGDNVFSYIAATPAGDPDGAAYTVNYTVTDQQSNSLTGSVGFSTDKAGQTVGTAYTPVGSGSLDSIEGSVSFSGDADVYRINICDSANFSATTVGNGTVGDTQLFLFTTDGMGVTFDDDSTGLLSTITGQFVAGNGDFLLAIARYDNDPQDSSLQPLWADTPFAVERQPDGPGAGSPFDNWSGFGGTGAYTITLTGACYSSGGGNVCGLADVGGVGGVQGADGHLDNNDFVVYIDLFFAHSPIADMGSTGGVPGADGVWDNNDFVVFIDHFFTAPASCR